MDTDDYWRSTTLEYDLMEYKSFYGKDLPVITVSPTEKWLDYGNCKEQYLYDGNDYRSTGRKIYRD